MDINDCLKILSDRDSCKFCDNHSGSNGHDFNSSIKNAPSCLRTRCQDIQSMIEETQGENNIIDGLSKKSSVSESLASFSTCSLAAADSNRPW